MMGDVWSWKENSSLAKTKCVEAVPITSTTLPVSNRQRSNEETSYAAAVVGNGKNESGNKVNGPPWGAGDGHGLRNGNIGSETTVFSSTSSTKTLGAAGSATDLVYFPSAAEVYKKPVGIQVDIPRTNRATVGCQTENPSRSQGQMTEPVEHSRKDESVAAKLCPCSDKRGRNTAVEFYGDHFNFEVALAKSVASLGISFIDVDFQMDEVVGDI